MSQLADPSSHDLRSLQQWLERPSMGNLALIGKDRATWGNIDLPIDPHHDLLAVSLSGNRDSFTTWFMEQLVLWLHRLFWHRTLHRYTSHITTIVASLLPILAIVVLYCVNSMKIRLGLIALFTFTFAAALSFFTGAKRGEIFIATST